MENQKNKLIESLFVAALEIDSSTEQLAFLQRACDGDNDLYQQVQSLLDANAGMQSCFLEETQHSVEQPDTDDCGRTIGPYRLLQKIGEGGMGSVFMAEQKVPVDRRVAVKIIKPGMDSKEVIARFEAERQALALMDHPNIAKVLDAGTTEHGQPYFVMELVKGMPVTEYCNQKRLTATQRLALFIPICQAVQHAHQKGIIHRDLKPSNVMIALYDGRPVPKVIDFGVAKATHQKLTQKTMFTQFGQIVGTLEYMSPEQAELNQLDIDTRSDIYSLGVLLYELLTGITPFDKERLKSGAFAEILRIIREEVPPKPSTRLSSSGNLASTAMNQSGDPKKISQQLRGDLDWIVMKAMEKDRYRRYESASGFAADIRRFLNSEPVVARPPSWNYYVRKFVHRNRIAVIAASLVTLALIGGIVGTSLAMVRARDAEQQAETRRLDAERATKAAEQNLAYARKGNEILGLVFAGLDPRAEYQEVSDLRNALCANLQNAARELEGSAIGDPAAMVEIQNTLGTSLLRLGGMEQSSQAIELFERALNTSTKELGLDHRLTLRSVNNLAQSYLDTGQMNKAQPLSQQLFELTKAKFGADHPDTLRSMHNLAGFYRSIGQLDKAVSLFEEVLAIKEAKLGPEHLDTLRSMNSLAECYRVTGQLDKAITFYEQTLELRKTKLGPNHPTTLNSMNGLARSYHAAGKLDKALPLYEQTLELTRAKLGPEHRRTLVSMNDLAGGYLSTGQLDKALPLFENTFELNKTNLGPDHPYTLNSMNNLAMAYRTTGQLDKAIPLIEQTFELKKAKLGLEHFDTLASMNNLALGYKSKGQVDKALPLFEQTLELRRANLGAEHPETLISMQHLAECYQAAHQPEKSLSLYEQTFELRKTKLGPDHSDTLRSMDDLLSAYATIGEVSKFDTLLPVAIEQWRKSFPENSPQLANVLAKCGLHLLALQRAKDAEPLLRECLNIRQAIQAEAWNTFNTQSVLGGTLLAKYATLVDEIEKANCLAEAETLLVAGYEGMKDREASIPMNAASDVLPALDRLIQLYTLLERQEEVKKYNELRAAYPKAEDAKN